jgi:predicted outer membrane repeat protein
MKTAVKSPESSDYRCGLRLFLTETPLPEAPKHLFRPLFPRNPHFPALRSVPMALSGASRRKQIPSSNSSATLSILLLAALFSLPLVHAKVVHVNAAAGAGGNGASWPTACRYLQDALDLTVAGDEVWVAAGTYYPDDGASVTAGDRTATFTLKQDVKLYGGFAGGETGSGQGNPTTNVSVLSGEIWTEKIYWSLHVVTLAGDATLDGFTVTKGNANGETSAYNQGAGVYLPVSKNLVIANCILSGNTAASSGGAISASASNSSVTATNCTFSVNTASSYGGAIYSSSTSYSSPITTSNCTFSGNTSSNKGGAIFSYSSTVTASNCEFFGNTGSSGGAIVTLFPSSSVKVTVTNCTFTNNSADAFSSGAGAITSYSLTATNCSFSGYSHTTINTSSGILTNCVFSGNTGIAVDCSNLLTATNCVFEDNSSRAIFSSSTVSLVMVTNCTFTNNTGGAIYGKSIIAMNCTFSGNTHSGSSSTGGAIYSIANNSGPTSVIATNCTFTNNSASSGGAIYASSDSSTGSQFASVTVTSCTFANNTASNSGGAIFSASTNFSYPLNLINCTMVNNLARGTGKKGGAIYAKGLVKVFNSISWHTLAETQDNLIYITSKGSLRNADVDFPSPLNQAKNLIKGGMAGITAEAGAVLSLGDTAVKVLSSDPLFLNASNPVGADGIWRTEDDGLRLETSSPAIDLGLSMFLPADTYDLDNDGNITELVPVDLSGYGRVQGAALDLGAYEAGNSFLPVTILTQPSSTTLSRDSAATFTVTATGYDLRYQWYGGTVADASNPIPGATANSYTTPELSITSNYWVRVSNGLGFVDSQTVTATVLPIIINAQPSNTVVTIGTTAALSVTASGKGLAYQWYQGASADTSHPMAGANLPDFTTPALSQTSAFWVRITNAYGTLDSDAATVSVTADLLATAMNSGCSLLYASGGNASWFGQTVTTHDGFAAAQSGLISHSQSTDVQTSAIGAGTISFWWNVSSQSGGDFLRFYIDGVEQSGSISGTTGTWAQKTFTVATAGVHAYKWAYTKNSSTSSGSDCGWVDEVVWTPKLITVQPAGQSILSGLSADLSVIASGTGLSYQWYLGDSGVTSNPILGANSPSYTTPALNGMAKYWVKVGNGDGFEASTTATVVVFPPDSAIATALNSGGLLSYFTWGNMPWIVQSSTTHDGFSALQSGAIGHSQSSVTEATVSGSGDLSFWWKVSSELGYDFLRFYIDGVEQGSVSGEVAWQQMSFNLVGSGIHRLKWTYVKDDSKTSGSDRAWLDQVTWQAAAITTYDTWVSGYNLTGGNALADSNPSYDGINNLLKYALGLNPSFPTLASTDGTNPGLPLLELSGASMSFTFIKDTGKTDVSYTVESCSNLATWSPVTTGVVETPLTGTLVRVVATIPVNGQRFCRLNVTK